MTAASVSPEKPTVTVLIDTFNYGHFIDEAISSVLVQDFPAAEMEILVVDDGSTDDTAERVAKYAGRVTYLHKPNGGQASAFNFGIARARGEFVALLDADDYWLPSKLRRVMQEFRKNNEISLVYHRFQEFRMDEYQFRDGDFNAVSGFVPSDKKKALLYTACQTSGLTFRTNLVKQLLPLNEAMVIQADGLLAALIIFLGPVVAIDDPLAVYRIHGSNLYFHTSGPVDKQRQSRRLVTLKVILDEMDKWLKAHGHDLGEETILAFRERWRMLYETEEFNLESPGRIRFFAHLWKAMHLMSPCLTPRIRAVNYLNAAGSLVVGYQNYPRLNEWRLNAKSKLLGVKRAVKS